MVLQRMMISRGKTERCMILSSKKISYLIYHVYDLN